MKITLHIDGFNLYNCAARKAPLKWLNLRTLSAGLFSRKTGSSAQNAPRMSQADGPRRSRAAPVADFLAGAMANFNNRCDRAIFVPSVSSLFIPPHAARTHLGKTLGMSSPQIDERMTLRRFARTKAAVHSPLKHLAMHALVPLAFPHTQ